MTLYWVHFMRGTVGLSVENGVVATAHESIRWAVGRPLDEVERMVRERYGQVERASIDPSPSSGNGEKP